MLLLFVALACSTPAPVGDPVAVVRSEPALSPPLTPGAAAVAGFWTWFAANEAGYRDPVAITATTLGCVNDETRKINAGLAAEFTVDADGTHVIVLTADGIREVFPAVQVTAAAAPAIPGWRVQAFRPAAVEADWSLALAGNQVYLKDFRGSWTGDPAQVSLDVWVPLPADTPADELGQIGFLALDSVLGEYSVETQVGEIAWHAAPAPETAKPLHELHAYLAQKPAP